MPTDEQQERRKKNKRNKSAFVRKLVSLAGFARSCRQLQRTRTLLLSIDGLCSRRCFVPCSTETTVVQFVAAQLSALFFSFTSSPSLSLSHAHFAAAVSEPLRP